MNVMELCESERGNTLLVDGDGISMTCVVDLCDGQWLQVRWFPENYPACNIEGFKMPLEELKAKLQERFSGWYARKNNIGLVLEPSGCVMDLEESSLEDGEENAG